jgi:2-polyprenyl-6-hydroxyphenyl methylase/3-demethylubiquinone-9 3-methyltransferase
VEYRSAEESHTARYLWPHVLRLLPKGRVFDLGAGNGAFVARLLKEGFEAVGVDPSESGVAIAKAAGLRVEVGSGDGDLLFRFGQFEAVTCLEVIEHCQHPRKVARCIHDLLAPGGVAVISTPYHGYLKNLALALTNRMDAHFTALWDGGHIKFWSPRTLTLLLEEAGLEVEKILRVGRVPPLAKSMVAVVRRPGGISDPGPAPTSR